MYQGEMELFSWGKRPGRDRAACTCSRHAHRGPRWSSHEKRGRPHHLLRGKNQVSDQAGEWRTEEGLEWAKHTRIARTRTVVALLTLGAVTGHVAETAARVAGLGAAAVGGVATAAVVTTTLGAVAGNVADLTALVALLAAAGSTTVAVATLGALARQVTGLAAAVAGALLGRLGALAV